MATYKTLFQPVNRYSTLLCMFGGLPQCRPPTQECPSFVACPCQRSRIPRLHTQCREDRIAFQPTVYAYQTCLKQQWFGKDVAINVRRREEEKTSSALVRPCSAVLPFAMETRLRSRLKWNCSTTTASLATQTKSLSLRPETMMSRVIKRNRN